MKKALLVIAILAVIGGIAWLLFGRQGNDAQTAGGNVMDPTEQAPPQPPPTAAPVAVHYGGAEQLDACLNVGKVVGLSVQGDNFLSVRAAPDQRALETDRLKPDARFHMCDSAADDEWVGIVYEPGGAVSARCGVSSPVAKQADYPGPCRSGWVLGKYVQLVAG